MSKLHDSASLPTVVGVEMQAGNFQRRWTRLLFVGFVVAGVAPLVIAAHYASLWSIYTSYVATLTRRTGLHPYLASALTPLAFAPFVIGMRWALSLRTSRRRVGIAILVGMFMIYNLVLFSTARDAYFTDEGEPLKYYAVTPDGVEVHDQPGFARKYQIPLKPIEGDLARRLELLQRGDFKPVDPNGVDWFNANTGQPELWYYQDPSGNLEFFDKPVFHPKTGRRLEPVTETVRADWQKQQERQRREEQQRAAATATAVRAASETAAVVRTSTPTPEQKEAKQLLGSKLDTPAALDLHRDSVKVDRFVVELVDCAKSGPDVACELTIVNRTEEDQWLYVCANNDFGSPCYWHDYYCRAFDENGREHLASQLNLGTAEGDRAVKLLMIPGVPVRLNIIFGGVPEDVRRFAAVEVALGRSGKSENGRVPFVARFKKVRL